MHKCKAIILGLGLLLAGVSEARAQSYTLAPEPYQWVLTPAFVPVPQGCVWTYQAGTTTAIATYADNAGTPNGNPIIADNYGRFTAYLVPGQSYKFVYEATPCSAPSTHGTVLKTADNIAAVPSSAANVDITGTAGETISAGNAVYLSDGSGSKVAGQWYKADSTNAYSSSTAVVVGMAPSAVASGASGTFRVVGRITGLSSLTAGSTYYISTSGAITATAPANVQQIGQADGTTSLVLQRASSNGCAPKYTAQTTTYAAVACDLVVATSGTFTVTLPAAASNANKVIWVTNDGTGVITIGRSGSDTVGLATSQTLGVATASTQGDSMTFISDGVSNWTIQ